MGKEGIVYVMSNPAYSLLKIGRAADVYQRVGTLSGTNVPFDFVLEYKIPVNNFKKVEKEVHRKLDEYRPNKDREFFNVTVEKARACIEQVVRELNAQTKINFQPYLDWWDSLDISWQQIFKYNLEVGDEITEVSDLIATFHRALKYCKDNALRKQMSKLVLSPKFAESIEKWYHHTLNKRERKKFSIYNPALLNEGQIREVQAIERLDCFDNAAITNLEPLKVLKNLKYLDCKNTKISDLSPLSGLKNLEEICLNFTEVTSLAALENLPNLKNISCKQSNIKELEVERFKKKRPDCFVDNSHFL